MEDSTKIRGDVPTGKMEVSARVRFAQMLLDESEEGGGLIFAIADEFWAMFSVDFLISIRKAAFFRLSFLLASLTAAS